LILLAAALAIPAYAMADAMQPGLYRATIESPGEKPEKKEDCITQKDIDEGLTGLSGERSASCKVQDMKRGSGSVSYRSTCEEDGTKATTQVNGTFTRDSFDLNFAMSVNADPPIKFHMVGKRIGECKPNEGSKRGRK
jgi:hypothetical protein